MEAVLTNWTLEAVLTNWRRFQQTGGQRFECQTLPCGRRVVPAAVKETFLPSKELEQPSCFLAALLRGPDVAMRNGVNIQDPDGWVATQQVVRCVEASFKA